MNLYLKYVFIPFIALILFNGSIDGQNDFSKVKKDLLDKIYSEKLKYKKEIRCSNKESHCSTDSLYRAYDVDIDLTLGKVSFDLSWGDPVENPKIRGNRASNLFGPVRHNSDGSIRWHRGFDIYAPKGTPIMSVGDGVVSLVQNHPDFGLCVLVTHKRPKRIYYSFYAHLSKISVVYGEKVHKGTILGKSGTTGNASNLKDKDEHLHFEYRTSPKHGDKKQENPNTILRTKFYSADPQNKYQYNVGVVKRKSRFELY